MSKVFVLLYNYLDVKDPEVLGVYSSKELALEAFRARLTRKAAKSPEEPTLAKEIPELCQFLAEEGVACLTRQKHYYLREKEVLSAI